MDWCFVVSSGNMSGLLFSKTYRGIVQWSLGFLYKLGLICEGVSAALAFGVRADISGNIL